VGRKIADVRIHGRMPKALEAKEIHFLNGPLRRPVLKGNAVSGNEDARTVVAKPAMDINRFFWLLLKKGEELNKLLVLWRRPATGANIDEAHAAGFRALSFGCDGALPFAAEIHDGGDADFFQLLDALFVGLRAAIKETVDLARVGNAIQLDLFGKWRSGRMGRISGTNGTCASGKEKEREKQSKSLRARGFHKERAFNHLDRNCKCEMH